MEIKGRQVLKIKEVSVNNKYSVEEGHSLFGQTYNLYQYNGIVFTVNTKDEFVQWRNSGELFSVDFTEGTRDKEVDGQFVKVQTLQLVGCTNLKQEVSMAKAEAVLARIYRDAETSEITDDLLAALQAS